MARLTLTLYSVIDTPALEETIIPAFKEDYSWASVETVGMGLSKISSTGIAHPGAHRCWSGPITTT
jgi:hypothetical protein